MKGDHAFFLMIGIMIGVVVVIAIDLLLPAFRCGS